MVRTVEAVIDEKGNITLLERVKLDSPHKAYVMVLDEPPIDHVGEGLLLSESALGEDWSRPEEEKAWSFLQQAK